MTYKQFFELIELNTVVVIIFIIVNFIQKNDNKKGVFLKAFIMLVCPVVGPVFYALSAFCYRYVFSTRADLSDVIFSKDRVETNIKADVEKEKNMVSLEEALAITDKQNLRQLMMNVVKKDVKHSLGAVSMALNSEDSETAHYAASVLQDELNDFRDEVQRRVDELRETKEKKADYASKLLNDMNFLLHQKVFTRMEQESFVWTMDSVAEIMYACDKEKMTGEQFEAMSLRLLELEKFERCKIWCTRCMEQYPDLLSSYTCFLKLYFTSGKKEEFFDMLNRLKKSNIIIDNETLELMRVFSK